MGRSTIRATAVLATIAMAFAGLTAAPAAASADELLELTVGNVSYTGTVRVGETLEVHPDVEHWTAGTQIEYQWYLGDDPIDGAEEATHEIGVDEQDGYLSVDVTGSLDGYESTTVTRVNSWVRGRTMTGVYTSIVGESTVGQTLSASTGNWPEETELFYEWSRSGTVIGEGPEHVVTIEDMGFELTLYVDGYAPGYVDTTVRASRSIPLAVVPGSATISAPATTVGTRVSSNVATWYPSDTRLTREWLRDGVPTGDTGSTYFIEVADLGKSITLRVTGSKAKLLPATVTSNPIAVPMYTFALQTPTIDGPVAVSSYVTATTQPTPKTWAPKLQWLRDGVPIPGATKKEYYPTQADAGHSLTFQLSVTHPAWGALSATSAPVTVDTGNFVYAGRMLVKGNAMVGQTLTVKQPRWKRVTPTKFTYQWYADGKKIKKATKAKLKLVKSLKSKKISVAVTGSAAHVNNYWWVSTQTKKVVKKKKFHAVGKGLKGTSKSR